MKVVFSGHGSMIFYTEGGTCVWLDPFFPTDVKDKADLILITHEHFDHIGGLERVPGRESAKTVRAADVIVPGGYRWFTFKDIKVQAVMAENKNHPASECVGYILNADSMRVYCAGDTSKTPMMEMLGDIDWAFLPIDGIYNMGPREASECAELISPRVAFPIHNDPASTKDFVFRETGFSDFKYKNTVVLRPGQEYHESR